MTVAEVGKILAIAAIFDARKIEPDDVDAWYEVGLKDLGFEHARTRVLEWYRTRNERLMPADIMHPERWIQLAPQDEWLRPPQ